MMFTRVWSAVARVLPVAVVLGVLGGVLLQSAQGEKATVIPPPAIDAPAGDARSEVAVFAGGCFWGVQAVFQHVKGVTSAVSGYAGGEKYTAHYDRIGERRHRTRRVGRGHLRPAPGQLRTAAAGVSSRSRTIRPSAIARDPDVGPQYRSAIFPANADQERIATAYIAQLAAARSFPRAIATRHRAESPRSIAPRRITRTTWSATRGAPTSCSTTCRSGRAAAGVPDRYRARPVLVGGTR